MADYRKAIRPSVRNLKPYHLNERACRIKLNQNESPYDLPKPLKHKWLQEFSELPWNRYPAFSNDVLKNKLSSYLDIAEERLLIGNGSNDLLQLLIALILPPQSTILIVTPTFTIYQQLATITDAKLVTIDLDADLQFPVGEIIAALNTQRIDLCIFCSPNSPTGSLLSEPDLGRILKVAEGLVLVDEAYFEFTDTNYSDMQATYENLILSRTFSKAFGLAGLRIGYFIGSAGLISELSKAKLPYNLNLFSDFMAVRLLDNHELIKLNVETILKERELLLKKLREIEQLRVYSTAANFFMIDAKLPADALFAGLVERGVLVRDISKQHRLLHNKLRITVGSAKENAWLVESLQQILAEPEKG